MEVVSVLKLSKEYQLPQYQFLKNQIPGLKCFTDADIGAVPLKHNLPGWWSKIELFNPEIQGDFLYLDLDTVVFSLDWFQEPDTSLMLKDFWHNRPASGMMYIRQEDKSKVWSAFWKDPERVMHQYKDQGDQGFIGFVLPHRYFQSLYPDTVYSYKTHCKDTVPDTAKVVCFHGQPRPWDLDLPWIPKV